MENTYNEHKEKFNIFKSKGINYYPHFHEQVKVVYCLQESINATIDGKDYELSPGEYRRKDREDKRKKYGADWTLKRNQRVKL